MVWTAALAADGPPSEVVIGVGELERVLDTMAALGFQVRDRGPADATAVRALNLPVDMPAESAVVASPSSGAVLRVMAFPKAVPLRGGAALWEIGGVSALQIAVPDLNTAGAALRERGWDVRDAGDGIADARGPDGLCIRLRRGTAAAITSAITTVGDLAAWRRAVEALDLGQASAPARIGNDARGLGLPTEAAHLAARSESAVRLPAQFDLTAWAFSSIRGVESGKPSPPAGPRTGILGVRVPVTDAAVTIERAKQARLAVAVPLQIVTLSGVGTARLAGIVLPGGTTLEVFTPGARPMSEGELHSRFAKGGYATWVRFNNKLTGNVRWNADGTAHVKWDTGTIDEDGTWVIKGDAVCTAWTRLRFNREVCVQHYRLDDRQTQSFRVDGGGPDGIYTWQD